MTRKFTRSRFTKAAARIKTSQYKHSVYGVIDRLDQKLDTACKEDMLSEEIDTIGPVNAVAELARLKEYILEHISVSDILVDLPTMKVKVIEGLHSIVADLDNQRS